MKENRKNIFNIKEVNKETDLNDNIDAGCCVRPKFLAEECCMVRP